MMAVIDLDFQHRRSVHQPARQGSQKSTKALHLFPHLTEAGEGPSLSVKFDFWRLHRVSLFVIAVILMKHSARNWFAARP